MFERFLIKWYTFRLKRFPDSYYEYLNEYNSYYLGLDNQMQTRFKTRLYITKKFIKFKPVKTQSVTAEMQILILSAWVQMTFGLEKYVFRRFKTIYVLPHAYSFAQYEALLGHVDYKANVICLSWPSVQEGFIIPNDASNVALHELAHALQAENHVRSVFSKIFNEIDYRKFNELGVKKLFKIREKRHKYLRAYAGNNMIEFFAVCIETFFEQPDKFNDHLPDLFAVMVNLLKQDPRIADRPPVNTEV